MRKAFIKLKPIKPTLLELESFKVLQEHFRKLFFLIHFDLKRKLYTDLDASKQYRFGIIIYHIKDEPEDDIPRNVIEPIMFLSKKLNNAEKNY